VTCGWACKDEDRRAKQKCAATLAKIAHMFHIRLPMSLLVARLARLHLVCMSPDHQRMLVELHCYKHMLTSQQHGLRHSSMDSASAFNLIYIISNI